MWQCTSFGKDTQKQASKPRESGSVNNCLTSAPLSVCLRPKVVIAPAGLSPKPGRPRPQSAVRLVFGLSHTTRWLASLAGWLEAEATLLAAPRGTVRTCLAVAHLSNIPRASSLQLAEEHNLRVAGQGQGYNASAGCSDSFNLLLFGRAGGVEAARALLWPALYHAYSLPALGPPPRLLAPGIETIEIRPCRPSSTTSYPTGGSLSSSLTRALFP